jgi:hypothetical protein
MATDLVELTSTGTMRLHMHPGQWRAWESVARWVVVLAGTQGGKTVFGPHWLYREIQRCGPGDYLVVTPTFQLLEKKALPTLLQLFEHWLHLGRYVTSPSRKFVFSPAGARRTFGSYDPDHPTTIWFGYAEDPESLESATIKAAWLDEAGQRKFKLGSWQAIKRRLAIHQGRALITTTPYDLGWLKQQLWDRWLAHDPTVAVINFPSTQNPAFPVAEYEAARRDLPAWKFALFYQGRFEQPAGLIYDSFRPATQAIPRFPIPAHWPRYLGLDFGGVNTAGLFIAAEPGTTRLIAYREYKAGGRTAKEHAVALLAGEARTPDAVGGSKSEGQWRQEFRMGGLAVREPGISDVEVGIGRVYGVHARDELRVFDDLAGYLEEKQTYSRVLDVNGEPTEAIEDKHSFHFMDAERYIISWLRQPAVGPALAGGQRSQLPGNPYQPPTGNPFGGGAGRPARR